MIEATTGFGKSKISIDLINSLSSSAFQGKSIKMLLLVAKRVHKQTWKEEVEKWGGIKANIEVIDCYESLHKHAGKYYDIVLADEVHHIGSDLRLDALSMLSFKYFIGLSATIPRKLKQYFKYKYHSKVVSCNIQEAIEGNVLPEPQILLYPLHTDNTVNSEIWVLNPKATGIPIDIPYSLIGKYKKQRKTKVFVHCTPKQYLGELNVQILSEKNRYLSSRNKALEKLWLYHCGKRLEFLAKCKVPIVKRILKKLDSSRTITFCKTIEHCNELGKNCIHSKNAKADEIYDAFNKKKINHITAVNILNENANLVDCKYAVFANISSSDIVMLQRTGRALRHKHPVIIIPYYAGTREDEILQKMFEGYNENYIKYIHSIDEI